MKSEEDKTLGDAARELGDAYDELKREFVKCFPKWLQKYLNPDWLE